MRREKERRGGESRGKVALKRTVSNEVSRTLLRKERGEKKRGRRPTMMDSCGSVFRKKKGFGVNGKNGLWDLDSSPTGKWVRCLDKKGGKKRVRKKKKGGGRATPEKKPGPSFHRRKNGEQKKKVILKVKGELEMEKGKSTQTSAAWVLSKDRPSGGTIGGGGNPLHSGRKGGELEK